MLEIAKQKCHRCKLEKILGLDFHMNCTVCKECRNLDYKKHHKPCGTHPKKKWRSFSFARPKGFEWEAVGL